MTGLTKWTGKAGDNLWESGQNWTGNQPPSLGDTVQVEPSAALTVQISSVLPSFSSLTIGDGSSFAIVLQLNSGASLATTGAMTFAQGGGGNVTIEGQGSLSAGGGFAVANGSGASILAGTATTGGMLDVTGAISSGITLGFANTTVASTLKLESTSTLDHAISITSSTQTLEIGATASVTLNTSESVANGTIKIDGGVLAANSLSLGANANLVGSGTLSISGSTTGSGTITASGGTLTITGAVSNSGAASQLVIASGCTLILSGYALGSSGSAPTLTFQGSGDLFQSVNVGMYNFYLGAISDFSAGDTMEIAAFGSGDKIYSFDATAHTITISTAAGYNQKVLTFDSSTDVSKITLSQATVSGVLADVLVICFMAGTLIRTPDGEVAVETLKRGDLVLTAEGVAKPIAWLGLQTVSSLFSDPMRNWPIRIKAGALAENVPARDLFVSPDHALLVDGVLVHAGALVNESSIVRETQVPQSFTYYHVELDDHSLILAENVPAETFIDNVDRTHFDNWAEHEALYPQGKRINELPYPRVKSSRQLPQSIRAALADRARRIGASARAVA